MPSELAFALARAGTAIYEERLKERLEATNMNDFVAIEPESGDYFLGETMSEAIQAARAAHPDKLTFTMRVGHSAAVEIVSYFDIRRGTPPRTDR